MGFDPKAYLAEAEDSATPSPTPFDPKAYLEETPFDPKAYLESSPGIIAEATTTGYTPESTPMEGGPLDKRGRPLFTLDAYRRGEVPFVTIAGDPRIPYGTPATSPQFPGVPFRINDTGQAFNGKGLSRFDVARDDQAGATADENNGPAQFDVGDSTAPYGLREDGTPKGEGFFGPLTRPDGDTSTELSIGVDIDGQETLIPALVPTLDENEISSLLKGDKPSEQIVSKAADFARQRIAEGKSPFAGAGEQIPAPKAPEAPPPPPWFNPTSAAQTDIKDAQLAREHGNVVNIPQLPIAQDDSIAAKTGKATYNAVTGLVSGATSADALTMLTNPVVGVAGLGHMAVDLVKQYRDVVSKTPAWSPERFNFGAQVATLLSLPAVHAAFRAKPNLQQTTREGGEIQYGKRQQGYQGDQGGGRSSGGRPEETTRTTGRGPQSGGTGGQSGAQGVERGDQAAPRTDRRSASDTSGTESTEGIPAGGSSTSAGVTGESKPVHLKSQPPVSEPLPAVSAEDIQRLPTKGAKVKVEIPEIDPDGQPITITKRMSPRAAGKMLHERRTAMRDFVDCL